MIAVYNSKTVFFYYYYCMYYCFVLRLGESEGSYCTLATFPSESSSSSSSESSTPSTSPPTTPLQEKPRKVQKHQRYILDGPPKHRNNLSMSVASLRVKPTNREVRCRFILKFKFLITLLDKKQLDYKWF